MRKEIVPCFDIDADARWGFSHTRGGIIGYKLHIVSSPDSMVVPLSADITTAKVSDNHVIQILYGFTSRNNKDNSFYGNRSRLRWIGIV